VNVTTELIWDANDPDEDPLTYDVYFGEAPNVTDWAPVAANISDSWYYPPEDLDYNTTYYWVVDVYDWMNQTEGDLWNFTTEAEPTPAPEEWNISISVGVGIYTAMNATFGMRDGANSSFNAGVGDNLLPPGYAGVESYFYYPAEVSSPIDYRKLIVSYLSVDYPANWTLRVHTFTGVSGLTTMDWNATEVEAIPGDYAVTLVTPTGDVDMIDLGSYEWTAEEEMTYTFMIIVEEAVLPP